MRIIEGTLAQLCKETKDCVGNKDADPEISQFFYRLQQRYIKGWRECELCKGTGRSWTVYPTKWGNTSTVEHECLTCNGLGFYDANKMVAEYKNRLKRLDGDEDINQ